MPDEHILLETKGDVLLITLNRPNKLNAFTISMYQQLAAAYGELDRNPSLRCGVLAANGKHFTAGLDLAEWAAYLSQGKFPDLPEGGCDPFALDPNRTLSKPMLIATQGICYTIGLELLLATDIRIAAENTRFGQIEVKRGILPAGGGTIRLVQELGWSNGMRYLLTGDEFSAAEAYRMGMVQEVVAPGQQLAHALKIAQTIAEQAPLAVYATLRSARKAKLAGETAAAAELLPAMQKLLQTEDAAEGVQSFIERRKANFVGR